MKLGNADISNLMLGNQQVGKVMLGDQQVWPVDTGPVSNISVDKLGIYLNSANNGFNAGNQYPGTSIPSGDFLLAIGMGVKHQYFIQNEDITLETRGYDADSNKVVRATMDAGTGNTLSFSQTYDSGTVAMKISGITGSEQIIVDPGAGASSYAKGDVLITVLSVTIVGGSDFDPEWEIPTNSNGTPTVILDTAVESGQPPAAWRVASKQGGTYAHLLVTAEVAPEANYTFQVPDAPMTNGINQTSDRIEYSLHLTNHRP